MSDSGKECPTVRTFRGVSTDESDDREAVATGMRGLFIVSGSDEIGWQYMGKQAENSSSKGLTLVL